MLIFYIEPTNSMFEEEKQSKYIKEPFFFFESDRTYTKEGKIENARIKELTFAMKEISLNLHQHAINKILMFFYNC